MAKILVVDDSPFEAKHSKVLLEREGHEVLVAENGMQGMKLIKLERPDLILLDLVLPDISGREVCRWAKLNAETQSIPIIILTARTDVKERVAGLEDGANDYVTKPCDDSELKARIDAVLREKTLRDQLEKKNTEYEELMRKFERMAITDPVTGLFNRRRFEEMLAQEFERYRRYGTPFTCLMIDVDHFKRINDTYGHDVGDLVLKETAQTIQAQIRGVDMVSRYGGDEFAVLLSQQKGEEAVKAAGRILRHVKQLRFKEMKKGEKITLSIGIAALPDPDLKEMDQMMQCADYALYKAKKNGRDCAESATVRESNQDPQ
ncbi:MAG: diguanylate cyclase [Candidatus Manganitrophus sp. SB1]|nr:diguanylate cyclase [Candidatus Manganitrophus morganii]